MKTLPRLVTFRAARGRAGGKNAQAAGNHRGRRRTGVAQLRRLTAVLVMSLTVAATPGCAPDPGKERLKATTKATYDPQTGRLQRLTYDSNKNGKIDTWTYMDGTRILRAEVDTNEDGKIDRWEIHGADNKLEKVGFSRADDGKADAWAFQRADGKIDRVEVSTKRDGKVDRWEWYASDALARAEEDTNGDGKADKWETYAAGALQTVAFDENGDAKPDRRLTYKTGVLVLIESAPDAAGVYTKRLTPAS
jgi:hypothetical protein